MEKLIRALEHFYYSHSRNYAIRALYGIFLLIGDVIFLVTHFVPKDRHLWIFGAWLGERYADNSKYLFEYVAKHQPDVRAVWLTRSEETLAFIRQRGFEAHRINSLKGLLLRIRSNVMVVSFKLSDVAPTYSRRPARAKIVQLWHGTPLKRLLSDNKFSTQTFPFFPRFRFLPFNNLIHADDLYIAASDEVRSKIASAFRVSPDIVAVTGYPRTDGFFNSNNECSRLASRLTDLRKSHSVGLYMPTHRLAGRQSVQLLLDDLEAIEPQLSALHVKLIIKLHFYHSKEAALLKDHQFNNVLFVDDVDINYDIYPILPKVDFLITDYSSVYFDYLLLDKPIIFAPFDIEDYTSFEHELYYHYDEVTPGPKAPSWEEVMQCITDLLTREDSYVNERRKVDSIFNTFHDQHSSRRVYEAIKTKLLAQEEN